MSVQYAVRKAMRSFRTSKISAAACCACAVLIICITPSRASGFSFGNEKIVRTFRQQAGSFGSVSIKNKLAGEEADVSGEEFVILLMNGPEIKSGGMKSDVKGERTAADGSKTFEIEFTSDQLNVNVVYSIGKNASLMKKQLRVCGAAAGKVVVDSVAVENFGALGGSKHGGFGQPLFYKDFYFGLESPAGYNVVEGGGAVLRHYPGWTLAPGECRTSYTAVAGVADKGQVEEAFRDYVDSFRYSWNSNILYNSWYDVQVGMNLTKFKSVLNRFNKGMGKYGVKLDYLVVDDGWQDRDSIWETSRQSFPKDFGPLRELFEEGGSKLGIWLPLCGYKLNARWGAERGLEADKNMQFYCLAGPKYNEALRARLKNLVLEQGAEYFKHDFNFLECYNPELPYPQTKRHAYEANIDAEAGLLDYLHSLNNKVYLNVTSYMWLSPWWLAHADTLWIGSSDYGYDLGGASLEPRDWAITYVDGWMHRRLIEEGARYPTNAIMTHGIIDGVLNRLGGDKEGFRTWADNVVIYFGRGVYMRELYLSPELLDDKKWKFLAEVAKWAKANDVAFRRTDWVGGDPKKGDAYGYHHRGGGRNLFVLRNPGIEPQTLKLPKIGDKLRLRQIYPVNKFLKSNNEIVLGGLETVVLKGVPERDVKRPVPVGSDYEITEAMPGKTVYRVFSTVRPALLGVKPKGVNFERNAGAAPALAASNPDKLCAIESRAYLCRLKVTAPAGKSYFYAALYADDPYLLDWMEIDGKKIVKKAHEAESEGQRWRLFRTDVAPGAREIVVRIPAGAVSESPFAARKYRLSFYLESEEGVPASKLVVEHKNIPADGAAELSLPTRNPGKDRAIIAMPKAQQAQLDFNAPEFGLKGTITEDELKAATGAKIRMKVFGVHGDGNMKTIVINRAPSGSIPSNNFPFDFWQDFVIDIPSVKPLKKVNTFEVSNTMGGDFKFKDVALAVRLADGTWRETNISPEIQCSNKDWQFAEGTAFKLRSKPVKLEFQ